MSTYHVPEGDDMSLDNSPSHIRESRHLFAGYRRIMATIRVDLASLRFQPRAMSCIRCEWEGSKVRQPSAELYPEYEEWMDCALSDIATETGTSFIHLFELPDGSGLIEARLHKAGDKPRLAETRRNVCEKPLYKTVAGMRPAKR